MTDEAAKSIIVASTAAGIIVAILVAGLVLGTGFTVLNAVGWGMFAFSGTFMYGVVYLSSKKKTKK